MHPLLHNKYIKFAGGGLVAFIILTIVYFLISSLSSTSLGLSDSSYRTGQDGFHFANPVGKSASMEMGMSADMVASESSYYPYPSPPVNGGGYTASLENYEITNYSVNARTKQFDELCTAVANLKASSDIHFKTIYESTNNCRANFFVPEEKVQSILNTLTAFSGVEINRNTQSVTQLKEQLASQSDILKQQLNSVSSSLATAEVQLNEIAEFAKETNDAKTLSLTIREKLSLIDTLTQRKIQLTNQLDQILKQSAELNERIGVVEFSVNVNRSNPIIVNEKSSQWEAAWDRLDDEFTDTQIGITIFLGVFLLWLIRTLVYLVILIIVLRGVWEFVKKVWKA